MPQHENKNKQNDMNWSGKKSWHREMEDWPRNSKRKEEAGKQRVGAAVSEALGWWSSSFR